MRVTIDLPDYHPNDGIRLKWESGFRVSVEVDSDGAVVLTANKEGLISIAHHFLTLANPDIPSGNHLHLDSSNGLEDGSSELIIVKASDFQYRQV